MNKFAVRYATDEERLEARRRAYRESTMRRWNRYLTLRAELGLPNIDGATWQKKLRKLEQVKRERERVTLVADAPCPDCGLDALRDQDGTCLFCHPRVRAVAEEKSRCAHCEQEMVRTTYNKRFCSPKCRDTAWRQTDAGYAWSRENNKRRRDRRAA